MRILIKGAVLCGFADAFDAAYGDPNTPLPYVKVTPTRLGPALLPFRCPKCQKVLTQFCDPGTRECYRDSQRGFYWCPACGNRMLIDVKGMALPAPLEPGVLAAPCKVERGGEVLLEAEAPEPLMMLGAG
jgi:transcription elongation factor Elf1